MTEWQPIETAPKDGTRVRLFIPYNQNKFTPEQCEDFGAWDSESGEVGCWRFDGDDGPDDIQPTHWMPLPEPPAREETP